MKRRRLVAALGGALTVAGCLSRRPTTDAPGTETGSPVPSSPDPGSPDPSATPGTGGPAPPETTGSGTDPPASPSGEQSPVSSPVEQFSPASPSGGQSVEYVLRAGTVPDAFASATVTLRIVFVDRTADLGPCYPGVFSGPYKPTLTPLPAPAGECHSSERVGVDLTGIGGERSLGRATAPGSASGHALVLDTIDATDRDGDAIDGIYGVGGLELLGSPDPPDGPYGIEIGIEPSGGGGTIDYRIVSDRFDPSG